MSFTGNAVVDPSAITTRVFVVDTFLSFLLNLVIYQMKLCV